MNETLLIIDVSNLCYRAFHAFGDLSYKEVPTGVLYGFFRDIVFLEERFDTDRIAFCFDKGRPLREDIFPNYKITRRTKVKEMTKKERKARAALKEQIYLLRKEHLKALGFNNIFSKSGFEADDLMASLAKKSKEAVIVSSDSDMYQMLRTGIRIYNPHRTKVIDRGIFVRENRIRPHHWANVKALMGCATDDIPGVGGIGIKTAIKFLRNELKSTSAAYKKIIGEGFATWERNHKLTKLPFPNTPTPIIVPDEVTPQKWDSLMKKLGMRSLRGQPPISAKNMRRHHANT